MNDVTRINFESPGPVSDAFLHSNAKVSLLLGPYGSAKTTTGTVTLIKNIADSKPDSDGVIRWRGVVLRSTYQMLTSALIPTFQKILPDSVGKITFGSPITKTIKAPGIEATIDFLAMDQDADRRRIEGSNYNFAWIDESRETSWALVQTLLTRVRAKNNKGDDQPLRIIFTSNPSSKRHWMYDKFVENDPPGWELFKQPGGRDPAYENKKYLPDDYYDQMVATSDPSFVKVHVDCEWGDEIVGAAIVPEFKEDVFVAKEQLQYKPGIPLVIGADCGPTLNSAALIAQLVPLHNEGKVIGQQLQIIGEWYGENKGATSAARDLRAEVEWRYGELEVKEVITDPSAANQKEMGNETMFIDIWKAATGWNMRPCKTNLVKLRIEGLRSIFQRLVNGNPAILICPSCTNIISALAGEYRWKQVVTSTGLSTDDKIDKHNRPFADLGDALGYLVLGIGEYDLIRDVARMGRKHGKLNKPFIADGVEQHPGLYGSYDNWR